MSRRRALRTAAATKMPVFASLADLEDRCGNKKGCFCIPSGPHGMTRARFEGVFVNGWSLKVIFGPRGHVSLGVSRNGSALWCLGALW